MVTAHKRLNLHTSIEGVRLRTYRVEDARRLFLLIAKNKDYLNEFAKQTVRKFYSRSVVEYVIRHPDPSRLRLGIWIGATLVGEASFTFHSDEHTGAIGYWVEKEHRGKGIAPAAIQTLLSHVFKSTDITHAYAYVDEKNHASKRVLEKIGMRPTQSRMKEFAEFVLKRSAFTYM